MVSPHLTQSFSASRGESTRYIRVPGISKTGRDPFKEYLHSFSFSKLQKYMVTFFKEMFFCGISTSPLPTKQTDYSLCMYISHIFLFLVYLPHIWVKSKKGKKTELEHGQVGAPTVSSGFSAEVALRAHFKSLFMLSLARVHSESLWCCLLFHRQGSSCAISCLSIF